MNGIDRMVRVDRFLHPRVFIPFILLVLSTFSSPYPAASLNPAGRLHSGLRRTTNVYASDVGNALIR